MSKTQLSSSEIQDLINRYHSELKKLEFQVDDVITTIAQLERLLENVSGREKSAITKVKTKKSKSLASAIVTSTAKVKKGKRGRPKKEKKVVKSKPVKATKKKARIKKKAQIKNKGYKLSVWDQYVIDSIKQAGSAQITQEIIELVKTKTIADKLKVGEEEIKNKVTRSLQKLANRRNDIIKVAYKGKGFAYAVPSWLNSKGKLDTKFKR